MRKNLTTLLTVIGAVTVLVLAANTVALATTGKALIAGKTNTSSKLTAIKRTTTGSALQLTTKSSKSAPLIVNGTGKVTHLNADKLDGFSSGTFLDKPYLVRKQITTPVSSFFVFPPSTIPSGYYYATFSAELNTGGGAIGTVRCGLAGTGPGGSTEFVGWQTTTSTLPYASVSGAGVVYKPSANAGIDLQCYADANVYTSGQQPVQLTLSHLDGVKASADLQSDD